MILLGPWNGLEERFRALGSLGDRFGALGNLGNCVRSLGRPGNGQVWFGGRFGTFGRHRDRFGALRGELLTGILSQI